MSMQINREEGVENFYVVIPLGWFLRVFARLSCMGRVMFSSQTVTVRLDDTRDMSHDTIKRLMRLASTKLRIYYRKMKDFEEVDRLSRQTSSTDAIASGVETSVDPIYGFIRFTIMPYHPRETGDRYW